MGGGTATGEMSYSKMSQKEVNELIVEQILVGAFVYEIGCNGKSAVTFGSLMKNGLIGSYLGCNTDNNAVNETRKQGLTARLVTEDFDHKIRFESLKKSGGKKTVVAMFGLPEVAPEAAESYAKQARDLGIRVISYPEI